MFENETNALFLINYLIFVSVNEKQIVQIKVMLYRVILVMLCFLQG